MLTDELPVTVLRVAQFAKRFQRGHKPNKADYCDIDSQLSQVYQVHNVTIDIKYSNGLKLAAWEFAKNVYTVTDSDGDPLSSDDGIRDAYILGEEAAVIVYRILNGRIASTFWARYKSHLLAAA